MIYHEIRKFRYLETTKFSTNIKIFGFRTNLCCDNCRLWKARKKPIQLERNKRLVLLQSLSSNAYVVNRRDESRLKQQSSFTAIYKHRFIMCVFFFFFHVVRLIIEKRTRENLFVYFLQEFIIVVEMIYSMIHHSFAYLRMYTSC